MISRIHTFPQVVFGFTFALSVIAFGQDGSMLQTQAIFDEVVSPTSAAFSPDGKNLYVAGGKAFTLVSYRYDELTDEFLPIDVETDELNQVDGLRIVYSIAVSPDGSLVYVAGLAEDSLTVFKRDAATGALNFANILRTEPRVRDGLEGAISIAISAGGNHIYVAGQEGTLTIVDGSEGANNLGILDAMIAGRIEWGQFPWIEEPTSVQIAPGDRHVYVKSRRHKALALFDRDSSSGTLSFVQMFGGGIYPQRGEYSISGITFTSDGTLGFATGDSIASRVPRLSVYSRDIDTGYLVRLAGIEVDSASNHMTRAALSADDRFVYVGTVVTGEIFQLERRVPYYQHRTVQKYDWSTSFPGGFRQLVVSPDGKFLLALPNEGISIAIFKIDEATGHLELAGSISAGPSGVDRMAGVAGIALSPDEKNLYVAAEVSDSVVTLARDTSTGQLSYVETHVDGEDGYFGLEGANAVAVSPDGQNVFVTADGDETLINFLRDSDTGMLTYAQRFRDGDGISSIEVIDGLGDPVAVVVSPDGTYVYVASNYENSVAVFVRDEDSGLLRYDTVFRDGASLDFGIGRVTSLAVSPDGSSIYTAGLDSNISVFARNESEPMHTHIRSYEDVHVVRGFSQGFNSIIISPDGNELYLGNQRILRLSRDRHDGSLGMLPHIEDLDFNEYLEFGQTASTLALSFVGSGRRLYATSDVVSIYNRDLRNGDIALSSTYRDGENGIFGTRGSRTIAVTSSGSHVYTGSRYDDIVAVFQVSPEESVSGILVDDRNGEPLQCATVEIGTVGGETIATCAADWRGYWSFVDLLPGNYQVRAVAPYYHNSKTVDFEFDSVSPSVIDFRMKRLDDTPLVAGLIRDGDGHAPVPGVLVSAMDGNKVLSSTYSCTTGAFSIALSQVPTSASLTITYDAIGFAPERIELLVDPTQHIDASINLQRAETSTSTLAGSLYLQEEVNGVLNGVSGGTIYLRGPMNLTSATTASGAFEFAGLPAGDYWLRGSVPGLTSRTVPVTIQESLDEKRSIIIRAEEAPNADNNDALILDPTLDGTWNSWDIQTVINSTLRISFSFDTDMNRDGITNSLDVQFVVGRVLESFSNHR